jgi:hypothetical protein
MKYYLTLFSLILACVTWMSACAGGPEMSQSQSPSLSSDSGNPSDEVAYCVLSGGCATEGSYCCQSDVPDSYYCWRRWHTHKQFRCCNTLGSCTNSNQCCLKGPGHGCIIGQCH